MAKRSRYNQPIYRPVVRDVSIPIARPRLLPRPVTYSPTVSDRRVFDFERQIRRAVVTFGPRLSARLVARTDPARISRVPTAIAFADPRRVDLCRRREARREVLHAKRIAGGRGFRKKRFNQWSQVRC